MSTDLEELGDIADQCAISVHGLSPLRHVGKKPFLVPCASQDHLKPPNIRFYTDSRGRRRYTCRLCDKARRRKRPPDSIRGYPL